ESCWIARPAAIVTKWHARKLEAGGSKRAENHCSLLVSSLIAHEGLTNVLKTGCCCVLRALSCTLHQVVREQEVSLSELSKASLTPESVPRVGEGLVFGNSCGLDFFHVHPIGRVLARIASGAVSRFFAIPTGSLQAFQRQIRKRI